MIQYAAQVGCNILTPVRQKLEYIAAKSTQQFIISFSTVQKVISVIAVLMAVSFGVPILQFFFIETFGSSAWGY